MEDNKNTPEVTPEHENYDHDELRGISVVNPFLGFIIDHWQAILLGLIMSGAVGTFFVQKALIKHYKEAYNNEKVIVQQVQEDNANLVTQLKDQNQKIIKFGEDAAAKDKVINELQKTVDSKQVALIALRKKLNAKQAPTTCDESVNYLDNTVDLITW